MTIVSICTNIIMVSTMVRIHAMDVVKLGIAYAYENLRTEHGLKFPLSSNHITSY